MNFPRIIINFKTYKEATGNKALELAKICEELSSSNCVIGVAVQTSDVRLISSNVSIPVFGEAFDLVDSGKSTGFVTADSLSSAGAVGSLINHSEHQVDLDNVKDFIDSAKKNNLFSVVCSDSFNSSVFISSLNPDCVAFELPELIGGDVSVTSANPDIISKIVNSVSSTKVFCGAGIKSGDDVKKALELGVYGVLLASGFVLSDNPKEVLLDMVKAFSH